jgi:hypothetical protein
VEYERDRAWIVASSEARTVDLAEGESFSTWAAHEHGGGQFRVIPLPVSRA